VTLRKGGGNLINRKFKNIEEGFSLYAAVSQLLVDQFRKVSESKKASPRKRICPQWENDITAIARL